MTGSSHELLAELGRMSPLQSGQAHIWIWQVAPTAPPDEEAALLSEEEQARAKRFRFDEQRARWMWGHIGTRRILSAYTGCRAEALQIHTGVHGRPYLSEPWNLSFNLSHTGTSCAVVLGRGIEVGIDIEGPREVEEAVWRRVLTAQEWIELERLPAEQRDRAFLQVWTRKEAVAKADGRGIATLISETYVGVAAAAAARAVTTQNGAKVWQLLDVNAGEDLYGAIATSEPAEVTIRQLR